MFDKYTDEELEKDYLQVVGEMKEIREQIEHGQEMLDRLHSVAQTIRAIKDLRQLQANKAQSLDDTSPNAKA